MIDPDNPKVGDTLEWSITPRWQHMDEWKPDQRSVIVAVGDRLTIRRTILSSGVEMVEGNIFKSHWKRLVERQIEEEKLSLRNSVE